MKTEIYDNDADECENYDDSTTERTTPEQLMECTACCLSAFLERAVTIADFPDPTLPGLMTLNLGFAELAKMEGYDGAVYRTIFRRFGVAFR